MENNIRLVWDLTKFDYREITELQYRISKSGVTLSESLLFSGDKPQFAKWNMSYEDFYKILVERFAM